MKRIVIFGASGFVGKSLLEKLLHEKYNILVLKNKTKIKENVKTFEGNILDKNSFESKIKDNDIIINLAGQFREDFSNFIDLNINGGLNLLESCKDKKNIKIILISSIDVYGECVHYPSKEKDEPSPQYDYGLIKLFTN